MERAVDKPRKHSRGGQALKIPTGLPGPALRQIAIRGGCNGGRREPEHCALISGDAHRTTLTSNDVAAGVEFDFPLTAIAEHRTGKAAEVDQEPPIANLVGAKGIVLVANDEQALERRAAIEVLVDQPDGETMCRLGPHARRNARVRS